LFFTCIAANGEPEAQHRLRTMCMDKMSMNN
jgi:hypothetical protein